MREGRCGSNQLCLTRAVSSKTSHDGVVLAAGETGSAFFHRILADAAKKHAAVFDAAKLPTSSKVFKRTYGDAVARFESARIGSNQRVELAHELFDATLSSLKFAKDGAEVSLAESLASVSATAPKTAERVGNTGSNGGRRSSSSTGRRTAV